MPTLAVTGAGSSTGASLLRSPLRGGRQHGFGEGEATFHAIGPVVDQDPKGPGGELEHGDGFAGPEGEFVDAGGRT